MATQTVYASKDALLVRRLSDSTNLGAGKDHHGGVGLLPSNTNYLMRYIVAFDAPDWTGVRQLTAAIGKVKVRTAHSTNGSNPRFHVHRVQSSWSPGTHGGQNGGDPDDETWSASNTLLYPGPANGASLVDTLGFGAVLAGDVITFDLLPFYEAVAPATVLKSDGVTPCDGLPDHGILLISFDIGSSSRYVGFDSMEGSYSPRAVLTHDLLATPDAPVLDTVAGSPYSPYVTVSDTTPTLEFHGVNGEGDATLYDVRFTNVTTLSSVQWVNQTTGISGKDITFTPSSPLDAGETYSLVLRWKDSAGQWSVWSQSYFTVAAAPTGTVTNPASGGILAQLTMQTGWNTPRMVVGHSYSDPASAGQQAYRYTLYNSNSGGSNLGSAYTQSATSSSTGPITLAFDLTNGNYYLVGVEVQNANGVWSAMSALRHVRVRWARAAYLIDTNPDTVTSWSFTYDVSGLGPNAAAHVEFGSNSTTSAPGSYKNSMGQVSIQRYFHYRVWLMAWGSAAPASPTFNSATLTYQTSATSPDGWTTGTGVSLDTSEYVYGSQSLRLDGQGSVGVSRFSYQGRIASGQQPISVEPNTWYILHCRIKNVGNANGRAYLVDQSGNLLVATEDLQNDTLGEFVHVVSDPWYSGNIGQVFVMLWQNGGPGTAAFFDAIKFEASRVATAWVPGLVGRGSTVDAGGIQIDGTLGSVLRLMGSAGGLQDYVELGPRGLHAALWLVRDTTAPSGNPPAGQHGIWYDSAASALKVRDSSGGDVTLGSGGGGAPTTVNYLVGTADGTLSNEIVVGTTPGGELGGTWASPTVDSVHSGSAHHSHGTGAVGEVVESWASSNVTMTNTATEYDSGAAVTIGVGTWLLSAQIEIASGASNTILRATGYLRDGSTDIGEASVQMQAVSGFQSGNNSPIFAIVVVASGTKTITLSANTATAGAVIRSQSLTNSQVASHSTGIIATRIA